jgi:hypothetical protein
MDKINNLLNDILERKQVGTLYHFTDPVSIFHILNSGKLISDRSGYISFTRDKNFYKMTTTLAFHPVVALIIDGDKLSDKYKITPYDYYYDKHKASGRSTGGFDSESEERIKVGNVATAIDLNPFVKGILLTPSEYYYKGVHNDNLYRLLKPFVKDSEDFNTFKEALLKYPYPVEEVGG